MPGSVRRIWGEKLLREDPALYWKVATYVGTKELEAGSELAIARAQATAAYFAASRDVHKRSEVVSQRKRRISATVHELTLACGHVVRRAVAPEAKRPYKPKWLWCEVCNDAGRKAHNMRTPPRSPVTVMCGKRPS